MKTFTYELAPAATTCRSRRLRKTHTFTASVGTYAEALSVAQAKARDLSARKKETYDIVRIY